MLTYLLQVIIFSAILYGYYHFFLKNTKFHQYNRFYLLASTLLSLFIPLLKIPVHFNTEQEIPAVYQVLSVVRIGENNNETVSSSPWLSFQTIASAAYCIILGFILLRFLVALARLAQLLRRYPAEQMNDISFVQTTEEDAPFSFFRWLFWNKQIPLDSPNGKQIFRHELFHIRQKHSLDIIYLELLTVVCWINPFFHIIKKETKAIHEFLADRSAAGNQNNLEYAELLLIQVLRSRQRLVNPFFHNQIKRRIAMITNSSKTSYQYLRKTMVLPVAFLAITLVAVNCTSKDLKSNNEVREERSDVAVTDSFAKQGLAGRPVSGNQGVEVIEVPTVFNKVEVEAAFPGGTPKWREFLQKNVHGEIAADKGAPAGTYTVMAQFIVHTDGSVSDIKTLTNHGYGMEDEVARVIKTGPKWSPALQNGIKVNAYRKQPITFQVEDK